MVGRYATTCRIGGAGGLEFLGEVGHGFLVSGPDGADDELVAGGFVDGDGVVAGDPAHAEAGVPQLDAVFGVCCADRFDGVGPAALGPWDLMVDTMVGAALLGGLVAAGVLEGIPWGLLGLALCGWYLWRRNPAASMTFQAVAYGFFLVRAWTEEPAWIGVLVATIGDIMLLDWHRFVGTTLPTSFAGFGIGSRAGRTAEAD